MIVIITGTAQSSALKKKSYWLHNWWGVHFCTCTNHTDEGGNIEIFVVYYTYWEKKLSNTTITIAQSSHAETPWRLGPNEKTNTQLEDGFVYGVMVSFGLTKHTMRHINQTTNKTLSYCFFDIYMYMAIWCQHNMPHCMFSKTKGLIGARLFSISSSCDCTHDIDHSGTEAENGRKQTVN